MGCYLAPGYDTTIQDMEVAMAQNPRGTELIVAVDLNVDLGKEGDRGRDEDITEAVATSGLEDLAGYFFLRQRVWCRDRRRWATV